MVAQQIQVCNHIPLQLVKKTVVPFKIVHRIMKCPICGNIFEAQVDLTEANPLMDTYCSNNCRSIARDRLQNGEVPEEEFLKFISMWENEIRFIPLRVLSKFCVNGGNQSQYQNIEADDLRQEILIKMFLFMARSYKTDPAKIYEVPTRFIKRMCYTACQDVLNKERERIKMTETAIWGHKLNKKQDNETDKGLDSLPARTYSSEYTLDIYEILQEIKELMKKVPVVELAVERALNSQTYEGKKVTVTKNKVARGKNKALVEKYNLINEGMVPHYAQKGVECIYYNDPERIESYIDINNLEQTYRFNDKDAKVLGKPIKELSKEELIHFYKGERKCTVCGKWFKTKQFSSENIACSHKCKRALLNATARKTYAKRRQKLKQQNGCENEN